MTIKYRELKTGERPFFSKDDAIFLAEAPVLSLGAALLPEKNWRKLTGWLERTKRAARLFSTTSVEHAVMQARPEIEFGGDAAAFALRHAAGRTEHHMQVLKTYFPGGWQAPLSLEGEEQVRDALAQGKGAILWIAHFCFNALAVKRAFHEHGYKVWHLSRPEHGFSKSTFGIATINRIRVKAELGYLGGRVIIDRSNPGKAKAHAREILARHEMISITAGAWEGRRIASAQLLGGEIELATGAPGMALQNAVPLLPVVTVRDDTCDTVRVIIGKQIADPGSGSLEDRIDRMTQSFIDSMAPYIAAYPEQWRDWKSLKFVA